MYNNYMRRPTDMYSQRLNALEQQYYQQQPWQGMQGQPIQNLNQTIQPQASCYFVSSPDELNGVNLMPNNLYLGINQNTKEIYVRRMDNNGVTQLETYTMSANMEEKNDYKLILEQLAEINQKLGKEKNDDGLKQSGRTNDAGKTARSSSNEPF